MIVQTASRFEDEKQLIGLIESLEFSLMQQTLHIYQRLSFEVARYICQPI